MNDLDFSDFEPVGDGPADAVAASPAPDVLPDLDTGARRHRLQAPPMVAGVRLDTVTIRPPTQGEIDDWGAGVIASKRALFCIMTGLDPAVVKALSWPDSAALHQIFADMIPEFILGAD